MAEEQSAKAEPNTIPNQTPTTAKTKKLKRWQKIVIGIVGFFIAIFVIATVATSGPAKASDSFVKYILSGDSQSAYNMFSSEAKDTVTSDELETVVDTMSNVLADKAKQVSKSVEGESGKSATATVVYEVEGNDGTYELTVNLIKENDEWKVLNFDNSLKK